MKNELAIRVGDIFTHKYNPINRYKIILIDETEQNIMYCTYAPEERNFTMGIAENGSVQLRSFDYFRRFCDTVTKIKKFPPQKNFKTRRNDHVYLRGQDTPYFVLSSEPMVIVPLDTCLLGPRFLNERDRIEEVIRPPVRDRIKI